MADPGKPSRRSRPRRPPATTPESRERQLIDLAVGLAEKQIIEGTASAQVITHFLKLATSREALEQQKIRQENELTAAKIDSMASQARIEDLYSNALKAMRSYQGDSTDDDLEQ